MTGGTKRIQVVFFRTAAGGEPVREWVKALPLVEDRKQIGVDIKLIEFGWPIGMPVCGTLGDGLFEVRSTLKQNRIARILFCVDSRSRMVLLHGFIRRAKRRPKRISIWLARTSRSTNFS